MTTLEMDYSRVVLGIGNPGAEYEETRHNVGFMVLDVVAKRLGLRFRRLERKAPDGRRMFSGKAKGHVAQGQTDAGPFLLTKPSTYVNLSGDLAGPLMRLHDLPPESIFVIVDDLNLPLGRIRCRPSGSSGGHNGLKSLEQSLATNGYPRLRLGIGAGQSADSSLSTGGHETVDFVLAPFLPEEREVLGVVMERAADVICEWLNGVPVEDLMGLHNGFDAREVRAPKDPGPVDSGPADSGDV